MPNVFWAVIEVMAERARSPRAEIVLMSACMPAPPVPSEPLMVSIGVTCCSNVWFAVCSFLRLLSAVLGLQSKQKNGNYRNIVPFFITIVSKCISTSGCRSSERVKGWKGEKVKGWKGEKVKRWKGEKVKRWKGEKVKRWKNGFAYQLVNSSTC